MKKLSKHLLAFSIIMLMMLPLISLAADGPLDLLEETGIGTGSDGIPGTGNLPELIGNIIKFFLSFLGILAVILILYAGFLWMTAGGDTGKVDKAKAYIKNAVIGIIIIMSAYILTTFIIENVSTILE